MELITDPKEIATAVLRSTGTLKDAIEYCERIGHWNGHDGTLPRAYRAAADVLRGMTMTERRN